MSHRPIHGGRLNAAARQWNRPRNQWLDLSTGINPQGWPVPAIPPEVWQRLPEADDGLMEVIHHWAGQPAGASCCPLAGSQAAIQALPRLRQPGRVGVPEPGYEEHGFCWAAAGHEVVSYTPASLEALIDDLDVVVWIQPNNPTGQVLAPAQLLEWHRRLAARGGWLVVDEAFVPGSEAASLAGATDQQGLIVLRSLGKFFGLAGIRAGAMLATPGLCQQMEQALGPWALSGPSRYLMARALQDSPWQQTMGVQLRADSARLSDCLSRHGLVPEGGSHLFRYIRHPAAVQIAEHLARAGILVRQFQQPPALRFGLPASEDHWLRLERALDGLVQRLSDGAPGKP